MIWPDGSGLQPKISFRICYLKPVSALERNTIYDNLLYIVAGEVIHVSGKSWCDFIEDRIMKPLEMNNSAASYVRLKILPILLYLTFYERKAKLDVTKTNL
jgi:CubicO group peptidase (beta-lactamase class C family)